MRLISRIISWLVTLLIPLALTFLGLRLMMTHTFLQVEYRMPGFPPDDYGFTMADRLHYAPLALDYLLNNADISFLGDLTFPDGAPLYNGGELSHMQDVKSVVRPALWVGYVVWALLLAVGLWARFGGWWTGYVYGLRRGGWLTVGLAVVLGVFAAVSFWQFFTIFHSLFFSEGSWLFLYSDTLIRLFPMRFWQDAFLFAGIIAIVDGLALGLFLRPDRKPKAG
jgi:integral membrane protein (TIGR01906 family)